MKKILFLIIVFSIFMMLVSCGFIDDKLNEIEKQIENVSEKTSVKLIESLGIKIPDYINKNKAGPFILKTIERIKRGEPAAIGINSSETVNFVNEIEEKLGKYLNKKD